MKDIGLVLVQPTPPTAHDPLIAGVEHGLEEVLVRSGRRLTTRVVRDSGAELDVYRHWHATKAVDAVVLVRLVRDDKRIAFLDSLSVPFVAIADESQLANFSAVAVDYAVTMRSVIAHLTLRGHSNIAFVSAPADDELSTVRARAFLAEVEASALTGRVFDSMLTVEASQEATRLILAEGDRPTAIIYSDDVTAAAGQSAVQDAGLSVPADVAIVAWNDSVRCQAATPAITAMSNQAHAVGVLVGTGLIETVENGTPTVIRAQQSFIVERQST